ncbi:MAG: RIP metalloprotease RseP [Muricauda sp.]|uniref:Zinc metalloprotease n=1 Tax=Flagellimonas lutaonensis TaxID=516051 RepID=A0A0D5YTJ2_9FLAO|nr:MULTISPECIES: RIP metalloprotease RseP [Allomuricauda]AKA35219.1 zinc metalloprotease [Allomuricauda lutaonensis]MBC29509.1 RIP metalloprotease RseP [Allomuricauda sp.]|tara:strand:- start:43978 stop:45333 length:1356 start_codon:yes stop_codon:yes gene_type:complete
MSPIAVKVIQFFLSLSLLIILHELGHFIPAKIFKTRVEKFFLFFDVKFALFKKKIGETVYGIGWLPLGGYVKIAGMIDESMDTEAMKEEPKPWEFRSKPAWQRLIIMLGGVTVNFVLAVIIYIGMAYSYGDQYIPMESLKDGVWVMEENIGEKLGLQTGDKIVAIDGDKVENFNNVFIDLINGNSMTIERDGQIIEKEIPVDFIATLLEDEDKVRFLNYRIPFVIGSVPKDSQNYRSGLKKGDEVVRIGNDSIKYFDQAKTLLEKYEGQRIELGVLRNNSELVNIPIVVSDSATIGVFPAAMPFKKLEEKGILKVETKTYTLWESIPAGINKGVDILTSYVKQLKKIFNPSTGAYKGVGGFAAIGSMFPDTWDWAAFWSTTALISIILAFMNILPIPALDGGHVMFLLYEMVSGRKPSDKFLEYAQMVGFFLLIALLLFANGNDIYKALTK